MKKYLSILFMLTLSNCALFKNTPPSPPTLLPIDPPLLLEKEDKSWQTVEKAGFTDVLFAWHDISFAVAPNEIPYIAYQSRNRTTVMKYEGTSWQEVSRIRSSTMYISLAIDSSNTPYIAFANSKATVMKYDGTRWVNVGSAEFSVGEVRDISLAIDSSNTPYIAFANSEAAVMKYDGTRWVNVGSAGFSIGGADSISLAIAPNGTPYVGYIDGKNSDKATVMKYNSSSKKWEHVGIPGLSVGEAGYTSLKIASDGTPYLAYTDRGKARVKKFKNGSWALVGNTGFNISPRSALKLSLAIDSKGTPYVVYSDAKRGRKATVKKYKY